jgi:hypothetical protein
MGWMVEALDRGREPSGIGRAHEARRSIGDREP